MHRVLKFHFLSVFFYRNGLPFVSKIIDLLIRLIFSCDIKHTCKIDKTVKFYHNALGVVIHPRVTIGANCAIYQNVTMGGNGKSREKNGAPTIGKNVFIGAGAVILGPVNIGDDVIIGANTVVTKDVEAGTTVIGAKASYLKR